jgi:hypothetical protein
MVPFRSVAPDKNFISSPLVLMEHSMYTEFVDRFFSRN